MTAAAVEATGELRAIIWPAVSVERADTLITMSRDVIDDFPRCATDERVVLLPGGVRYRVGGQHPRRTDRVYLHRLDV